MTSSLENVTREHRKDELLFYKFMGLTYAVHTVIVAALVLLGN